MSFLKYLKAASVPEPLIEKWKKDIGLEDFTDLKYICILGDKKFWLEDQVKNFQGWDIFTGDKTIWGGLVEAFVSGYDIAQNVEIQCKDIDVINKLIEEKAKGQAIDPKRITVQNNLIDKAIEAKMDKALA